jgi:hypothetical protein
VSIYCIAASCKQRSDIAIWTKLHTITVTNHYSLSANIACQQLDEVQNQGVKYWSLSLTCLLVSVHKQYHKSVYINCSVQFPSLFVCVLSTTHSFWLHSLWSWVILITCRSFFRTSCHVTHGAAGREAWRGLAVCDWFSLHGFGDNAIRFLLIEVRAAVTGETDNSHSDWGCLVRQWM